MFTQLTAILLHCFLMKERLSSSFEANSCFGLQRVNVNTSCVDVYKKPKTKEFEKISLVGRGGRVPIYFFLFFFPSKFRA